MAVDIQKSRHHCEMAAITGHGVARFFLGCKEMNDDDGNLFLAMKHFMIGASQGYNDSLNEVKKGFVSGCITQDDYLRTFAAHKKSLSEIQSKQRDKAVAKRSSYLIDSLRCG